jgi:hypothetical protein
LSGFPLFIYLFIMYYSCDKRPSLRQKDFKTLQVMSYVESNQT